VIGYMPRSCTRPQTITHSSTALASPAMGHWGTCPQDFQLIIFSGHFRAAQTLTMDLTWLPIPRKNVGYGPIAFSLSLCGFYNIFVCVSHPKIIFFSSVP